MRPKEKHCRILEFIYCKNSDDTPGLPDLKPVGLLFAFWTDFTNMAAMLSDQLRHLAYNRRAYFTQVSDQCPLGLLFCIPGERKPCHIRTLVR